MAGLRSSIEEDMAIQRIQFRGYAGEWTWKAWRWGRASGLFGISMPDLDSEWEQLCLEVEGEYLGLDGLWVQEGVVHALMRISPRKLLFPRPDEMEAGDLLVVTDLGSRVGRCILDALPPELSEKRYLLGWLEDERGTRFFCLGPDGEGARKLEGIVDRTVEVLSEYRMYKGWSGYNIGYYAIGSGIASCHPFQVASRALQEGCSWILATGYLDFLIPERIGGKLRTSGVPFVLSAGQPSSDRKVVLYGLREYPNPQHCPLDVCLRWRREKGGYLFRRAYLPEPIEEFEGYLLTEYEERNYVDLESYPFVLSGGQPYEYPTSMVLFLPCSEELTEETLFRAILEGRAVGVFPRARLVGPRKFVEVLGLLLLERRVLEDAFSDRLIVRPKVEGGELIVEVENRTSEEVPAEVYTSLGNLERVKLAPWGSILRLPLPKSSELLGRDHALGVHVRVGDREVHGVAAWCLPPAVAAPSQMYAVPGEVRVPVTLWSSEGGEVEVRVEVFGEGTKVAEEVTKAEVRHEVLTPFEVPLQLGRPGNYRVKLSTSEGEKEVQVVVAAQTGRAVAYREDFDADGLSEVVLENGLVRVVIIPYGGRAIEYTLKKRAENLLFKVWPKTPPDREDPARRRNFWPYGGLEEFLGYPTFMGHHAFKLEILKEEGAFVRARASGELKGNRLEKTFTLYGDGTLLEVQYSVHLPTAGITVMGVNPLVKLGSVSDTRDVYYFPTINGLEERRVVHTRNYGEFFRLREGWVAGEDEEERISLVLGYPVWDAFIFHLWQNTPANRPTPYYYVELQPWVELRYNCMTYFTLYLLGHSGGWEEAVDMFRRTGLSTERREDV
ncbi:MAG TPA: hypothetical protein EYP61_05250 [Candidatus Latescibacteria bacterium]|nr:hypothetical protein [Candidatus Latescibacterota bacterium]